MTTINTRNQLDEQSKKIISKMEKDLEVKDKEIADLKKQLAYLQGQILKKDRKIFGSSSEQSSLMQLNFFDEAEKHSNPKPMSLL